MKHFPKLLFSLIVFCTLSVNAQKEKVEFPYTHESLAELIKDSNWLKASAGKYQEYINNGTIKSNFYNEIANYVILNENEKGLQQLSKVLLQIKKPEFNYAEIKALFSIYYGYFYYKLHKDKNNYYIAVEEAFAKCDPTISDRKYMYTQQIWPDTSKMANSSSINDANLSDDTIASQLMQFTPSFKDLHRPEKVLNEDEMSFILYNVSSRKMAIAIKDEQIKFANDQLTIIDNINKRNDSLWASRLYHFSASDKPQTIVAADFQIFDIKDFPASQIWVNKKEIPDNGIDDDKNRYIDDVNGVMYVKDKKLTAVGIPLIRKKAREYYSPNDLMSFPHGTLTIELMLKDNPYVKIMGLEHNQYDLVWKEIQQEFTKDIEHNRKLIDSLIDLRLKIWKNLVLYCKQNKVQVAEINSIGFLLNGNEFVLTGCGKDSADTKQFTDKKFWELVKGYDQIFKLSPNTLFIIGAGNDGIDNTSNKQLSSCIHTPNTLTVGALGKDLKKAGYSNYGKDVEIYAPAHFHLLIPNDVYPESSGTSAASPVTCNLAIKLLNLNPKLSPVQLKKLIIDSSDKNIFEEGINVINPKKAVALMRQTIKL